MEHDFDTDGLNQGEFQGFMGIIGRHPAMRDIFETIRRIGPSTASVLITGESGTGKELVARALHELSSRRKQNLIAVHCGAIPEELLESELFGHVKGAFTGAIAHRVGRFSLAHGGTIFLDEVGEMSARFQVKLLRVLEDGAFEAVGSAATQHVDVRVIAATHRDLRDAVRDGTFREDLFYRMDVVSIHLPSLRDRREDIALIADHFLRRLHTHKGLPRCRLSEDAVGALTAYDWPGNVRELRNVLERAVLLGQPSGTIYASDLPPLSAQPTRPAMHSDRPPLPFRVPEQPQPWDFGPEGTDFYGELEAFERRMISRALSLAAGSKREAARLLHVNRTTLLEKLKRRGWQIGVQSSPREGFESLRAAIEPGPIDTRPICVPAATFA
jgi:transcriptional regulator with GAF, ATPase, and Fis domain